VPGTKRSEARQRALPMPRTTAPMHCFLLLRAGQHAPAPPADALDTELGDQSRHLVLAQQQARMACRAIPSALALGTRARSPPHCQSLYRAD